MGFTEATVFTLGVVMGTASTIIAKLIFDMHSTGLNGRYAAFGKPLMQTWLMFIGMSCALPMYLLDHYRRNRRPVKAVAMGDPESGTVDVVDPPIPWSTYVSLLIPAAFDLIATALSGVGLMYCTVSVYQLVRCTVIIVTALLKVFVLGHRIPPYAWFGLFINTVAMVLVASTSFIEVAADEGVNSDPRIGIFFVLLSCIVQGAQYVFEERVMATGDGAPPLLVVGMEGIWGFVLMVLVVLPTAQYLPGSDNGRMEDTWDSLEMMRNNSSLCVLLVVFTVIVFLYNVFCIYVTNLLNSIWHAILDNFRPITVWGTDLALFYLITSGRYGERWGLASWFELAGMALLIFGTVIYNANVHLSCFDYSQSDEDDEPLPAALSGASFTPGSPRNTQARRGSSPRVGESVGLLPDRPPKKKVMASSRAQGSSAYGSSLGSD